MGFEDLKYGRSWTDEDRRRAMEKIAAEDEARRRSHAAWLRLCGSVAPIGRLQGD